MIADVRELMGRRPFTPFAVRTTDGREYKVPTVDHIWITPERKRIAIAIENDAVALLGGLHIAAVVDLEPSHS
jgi:hypothetical protein